MTWHREALSIYNYHTNQLYKFGIPKRGPTKTGGWSIQDTANYFNMSIGKVSENFKLGEKYFSTLAEGSEDDIKALQNLSRKEALELILDKQIKFWLYAAKIKGKNKLYTREDNNLPYIFNSSNRCREFCKGLRDQLELEPVKLEIRVIKEME